MITKKVFKAAFISSLPVLMGYSVMGMGAGILLAAKTDLNFLWAMFAAFITESAAIQYMQPDLINNVRTIPQIVIITILLNLRYAMYGLSLIERFRRLKLPRRLYMILTLSDETYALQIENKCPEGENSDDYCLAISSLDHFYWIFGCTVGAILGDLIKFNTMGIEFAMTALFIVILTDQCLEKANRIPSIIGAGATIFCRIAFGTDYMLIIAIALILTSFILLRPRFDTTYKHTLAMKGGAK